MDYYEELFNKIDLLIIEEKCEECLKIVEEELEVSYIPRDDENKLKDYYSFLKDKTYKVSSLSDEDIEEYLFSDKQKQLLAVDALNNKNLRDYKQLCEKFLMSDGLVNAKVLLIDSLIKQEINDTFVCLKDNEKITFNPSFIIPFEESNEFIYGLNSIEDHYMKEPSKSILAKQLLYKEFILNYPLTFQMDEINEIITNIIDYIETAFNSAN